MNRFHGFFIARILVLCSWIIAQPIYAAQLALGWDHSVAYMDGTPLLGPALYRVRYGMHSGQYDHIVEVGATNFVSITGLNERVTYYFTVTASDDLGLESPPSEELAWNSFTADYPALPSWLAQHGITNRAEDISEHDDDGDSVPIWQEFIMDTDPTDPGSLLELKTMAPVFGPGWEVVMTDEEPPYEVWTQTVHSVVGYVMNWTCSTNRMYDVQYTFDPADGTWIPMDDLTALVPTSREMIVTNLFADEAVRMLRLVVRHL